jgi:Tfp pilus assembly pilus retraction ATPase PilT
MRNWARISAGSLTVTGTGGSGLKKAVNKLAAMIQIRNQARDGQLETCQDRKPVLSN